MYALVSTNSLRAPILSLSYIYVNRLSSTLTEIAHFMENLAHKNRLKRIIEHRDDEARILQLNRQLDESMGLFVVSSICVASSGAS